MNDILPFDQFLGFSIEFPELSKKLSDILNVTDCVVETNCEDDIFPIPSWKNAIPSSPEYNAAVNVPPPLGVVSESKKAALGCIDPLAETKSY